MTRVAVTLSAAASCLVLLLGSDADVPGGIGIMGDSYSDEYQFSTPDRSMARNWVEILASLRGLDFGRFNPSGWGEPRNRGFEYNWARSDATTEDLIVEGQHTGLAAQVARGEVRLVFIFIGGNDFIAAMKEPDPAAALGAALPRALANYERAVRTILEASRQVRLVLVTVPDIHLLPEFRDGRIPASLAAACTAAMERYNEGIRWLAAGSPRIALLDLALYMQLADRLCGDRAFVAGRRLDRLRSGDSPDHFFLADRRHPGTLAQAELAGLMIARLSARFGVRIEPLHDEELRGLADSIWTRRAEEPPSPPPGGWGRPLHGG